MHHLENLSVGSLVAVSDAQLSGDGKPGAPDALEPGLLHDFGAQAVVGLHDELQLVGREHFAQLLGLALL